MKRRIIAIAVAAVLITAPVVAILASTSEQTNSDDVSETENSTAQQQNLPLHTNRRLCQIRKTSKAKRLNRCYIFEQYNVANACCVDVCPNCISAIQRVIDERSKENG